MNIPNRNHSKLGIMPIYVYIERGSRLYRSSSFSEVLTLHRGDGKHCARVMRGLHQILLISKSSVSR
jgi:hypothetical protein